MHHSVSNMYHSVSNIYHSVSNMYHSVSNMYYSVSNMHAMSKLPQCQMLCLSIKHVNVVNDGSLC